MSPLPLNVTLSILSPIIHWNSIVLYVGCAVSTFLCMNLFYIVQRYTPKSMHSRKYCLHGLLIGCIVHTLLYALAQPLPILPYRVGITLFSDMTYISSCAYITSLSNYVDITAGLGSGSKFFTYLRGMSLKKRIVNFTFNNLQNTVIALLTAYLIYIDYDAHADSTKAVLYSDFAMIQLKNEWYTGLFIMIFFGGYVIFYIVSVIYLNYHIYRKLKDLEHTVSERTYDVLEKMSIMFALVVISPFVFFQVPHLLFVICNYYVPSLVATPDSLEAITIIITVLYALFPFSFYVFLVVGFKQYRHAFFHILTLRRFEIKTSPTTSHHS
ncbi:hypothetical protein PMAYCL1PPCAC_10919 [Pristionchus mayeri]|uniref:G protein-coupled receptor n=1 Tax=Pristionchus mayeri TaxID=1317129 RepID=A0AAN4ZJZ6_9BILA|nr:hypothetical protein PMAYCL1PPCAC_10919 [Pristionchus mayeri]